MGSYGLGASVLYLLRTLSNFVVLLEQFINLFRPLCFLAYINNHDNSAARILIIFPLHMIISSFYESVFIWCVKGSTVY